MTRLKQAEERLDELINDEYEGDDMEALEEVRSLVREEREIIGRSRIE